MGDRLVCCAWNGYCSIHCESSLALLIDEVSSISPQWAVIFVSEFDSRQNHDFAIDTNMSHLIQRHWPGPGSRAMTIIILVFLDSLHQIHTMAWQGLQALNEN